MLRVDTITELFDAGELLARQPLPPGDRVAVVGNSDSMGLLTHDACLSAGLRPRTPVDLTTAATGENFRIALDTALADPAVDAVIAVAIPPIGTAAHAFTGGRLHADDPGSDDPEIAEALLESAARAKELGKPLLLCHLALTDLTGFYPGGRHPGLPGARAGRARAGARRPVRRLAPPHGRGGGDRAGPRTRPDRRGRGPHAGRGGAGHPGRRRGPPPARRGPDHPGGGRGERAARRLRHRGPPDAAACPTRRARYGPPPPSATRWP